MNFVIWILLWQLGLVLPVHVNLTLGRKMITTTDTVQLTALPIPTSFPACVLWGLAVGRGVSWLFHRFSFTVFNTTLSCLWSRTILSYSNIIDSTSHNHKAISHFISLFTQTSLTECPQIYWSPVGVDDESRSMGLLVLVLMPLPSMQYITVFNLSEKCGSRCLPRLRSLWLVLVNGRTTPAIQVEWELVLSQ
jgi:hypothetical protein